MDIDTIAELIKTKFPKSFIGKEAIQILKQNDFNWKQMEWAGFLLHRFEGAEGNQKDVRSKIAFIDTNDKKVNVWCCGAIFDKNKHEKFIRGKELKEGYFRTSVQCFCKEDDRVKKFNFSGK